MLDHKSLGQGTHVRMSHKNGAPPEDVEASRPVSSPAAAIYKTLTPSDFASASTTAPPTYIAPVSLYNESIPSPALSPWERAKFILGVTAIANAILTMVLTSVNGFLGIMIAPVAAAVALWNVAEMARRIDVPGGGGITPGAHVGMRLILCGSLITMAAMMPGTAFIERVEYSGGLAIAWTVIGMCGLGAAIEFVLFVRACCEEDWRRKAIRRERNDLLRKAGNLIGLTE
ncbi:hypothetical protein F5X68DRAFT_212520 [Plectosphaerella plurivora]|uniref:Uncharacterized protein n=1 Tax=Plectosphaerella plurivora TaxID=936078 RepID=A0A9P8V6Q9_9PEZI|nr:hypothetical protein F5X68DRAFT_212520 [Plectosphaerella plurivora]